MILVDTSVWINHFKTGNEDLKNYLLRGSVTCHPYIIGEIACGSIRNRNEILSLLQALPQLPVIELVDFINFIEKNSLSSKGIGFVDINLLASAKNAGCRLWTMDKKLKEAADIIGVSKS